MKHALLICLLLSSVFFIGCKAQMSKPTRYAELRTGTSNRVQVLICGDYWTGLVGPDGFGGYRQDVYYWTTLHGNGPDYTNVVFRENGSEQMAEVLLNTPPEDTNNVVPKSASVSVRANIGTITLDRNKKQVIIDLRKIISEPGGPQRTEPCPENGVYHIKRVTEKPFMIPE